MPYDSINDLPPQFKNLPVGAKRIALRVINDVLARGGSEESAFKQAWSAIKKKYKKVGDKWVKKEVDNTAEHEFNFLVFDVKPQDASVKAKDGLYRASVMSLNNHEVHRGINFTTEEIEKAIEEWETKDFIVHVMDGHPSLFGGGQASQVQGKVEKIYICPRGDDHLCMQFSLLDGQVKTLIDKELIDNVSIGIWAEVVERKDDNGDMKEFGVNLSFDHLAIVTHGQCSPADGCSISSMTTTNNVFDHNIYETVTQNYVETTDTSAISGDIRLKYSDNTNETVYITYSDWTQRDNGTTNGTTITYPSWKPNLIPQNYKKERMEKEPIKVEIEMNENMKEEFDALKESIEEMKQAQEAQKVDNELLKEQNEALKEYKESVEAKEKKEIVDMILARNPRMEDTVKDLDREKLEQILEAIPKPPKNVSSRKIPVGETREDFEKKASDFTDKISIAGVLGVIAGGE